jgi:hypothetical protein
VTASGGHYLLAVGFHLNMSLCKVLSFELEVKQLAQQGTCNCNPHYCTDAVTVPATISFGSQESEKEARCPYNHESTNLIPQTLFPQLFLLGKPNRKNTRCPGSSSFLFPKEEL